MKAFEQYVEKKFGSKNIVPDCTEAEAYLKGLQEGYRESLKWVMERIKQNKLDIYDVSFDIEEELKE